LPSNKKIFPSSLRLHCLGTRLSAHTARTPNALSPAAEVRPLSAFLAEHVRVDANLQAVDWHPRNVYCSVPPVLPPLLIRNNRALMSYCFRGSRWGRILFPWQLFGLPAMAKLGISLNFGPFVRNSDFLCTFPVLVYWFTQFSLPSYCTCVHGASSTFDLRFSILQNFANSQPRFYSFFSPNSKLQRRCHRTKNFGVPIDPPSDPTSILAKRARRADAGISLLSISIHQTTSPSTRGRLSSQGFFS